MQARSSAIRKLFVCAASVILSAGACQATQVIANWDLVPYQRIEAPFEVGVVAFHETGAHVVFKVDDVVVATVDEPAWNDRTGVVEYWFELDPSQYPDGALALTAEVFPDGAGHESRVLGQRTLYANSGGTLGSTAAVWADAVNGSDYGGNGTEASPYRTLKKAVESAPDGAAVYLEAGTYTLEYMSPVWRQYWTTVQAAPGLTADDVRIACKLKDGSANNQYQRSMIRWRKVTLYNDYWNTHQNILYGVSGQRIWVDGVIMYDANGPTNGCSVLGGGPSFWCTNSVIRDMWNGAGWWFIRNALIENICSDIFDGADNLTAINVTVRGVDPRDTPAHSDFMQWYNPDWPTENIIVYNCRVYDSAVEGFMCGFETEDVAIVNFLLDIRPNSGYWSSQMNNCDMDHVLMWHVTLDQDFLFVNNFVVSNWFIQDSYFGKLNAGSTPSLPASVVDYNHLWDAQDWNQPQSLSDHVTEGYVQWRDSWNLDFRLLPTSPAYRRGVPLADLPADIDGVPYDPATPNIGCFSSIHPGQAMFFRQADVMSDSSGHDGPSGRAEVILPGRSIRLTGDAWKYVPLSRTLRSDAVLEFTVDASDAGELLGIILDDDTDPANSARCFRVGGADVANPAHDGYSHRIEPTYVDGSGKATYRIPVGGRVTGDISYLGFVAADAADGSADVIVSDVRLVTAPPYVRLADADVLAYDPRDGQGGAEASFDELAISLNGDAWKVHPFAYHVTADTLLKFTVEAPDAGQVTAVALDDDATAANSRRAFRFGGSDVDGDHDGWSWRIDDLNNGGERTYIVPVGDYFTGAVDYLGFIADDGDDASANVTFSRMCIAEQNDRQVFDPMGFVPHGDAQDGQGGGATSVSVSPDGLRATLAGNAWKLHPLQTSVTIDTVLIVTVDSPDTGEAIGVVLDNDANPTEGRRAFILGGSDFGSSGFDSFAWSVVHPDTGAAYGAGSGAVTYRIPVGEYFTGSVTGIGLFADDDADASADATFSDIRLVDWSIVSDAATLPDADGDGDVDLADFVILKNHFGLSSGATRAQGDFDGDGAVNLADFVILKNNFGR